METVSMNLSDKQIKKLATGGAIMIKPTMMTGGAIQLTLHPSKCERMRKNHEMGKMYRLSMDAKEMKGGSFKSFLRKAGSTLKKGVTKGWEIYQRDYKPTYGPMIREGLKEGMSAALQILAARSGSPALVEVAEATAVALSPLVDQLGDFTQAFSVGQFKGNKKDRKMMDDAISFRKEIKGVVEEAMRIAGKKNKM